MDNSTQHTCNDTARQFCVPEAHERHDGSHDFDFEIGEWTVRNRRLRQRLVGCTEWDEFEATASMRALPDRMGNEEILRSEHVPGYIGMALRLYNPKTRLWSIHWVDNQQRTMEAPMVGAFRDGIGVFEGDYVLAGRPIRVRYLWSGGATPRWEQAFSADAGVTWETNWTMEFRRVAA